MTGIVDKRLRALISVPVAATEKGPRNELLAWIDTAFNGGLVIPRDQIEELGLRQESSAEAVLADGSTALLETFGCTLDWFGETYRTQIVANDGEFALLGTMLLAGRRLEIDYVTKSVALF